MILCDKEFPPYKPENRKFANHTQLKNNKIRREVFVLNFCGEFRQFNSIKFFESLGGLVLQSRVVRVLFELGFLFGSIWKFLKGLARLSLNSKLAEFRNTKFHKHNHSDEGSSGSPGAANLVVLTWVFGPQASDNKLPDLNYKMFNRTLFDFIGWTLAGRVGVSEIVYWTFFRGCKAIAWAVCRTPKFPSS